jgi:serine protease AprX
MGVVATPPQVHSLITMSSVRSVWLNQRLKYYNYGARNLTGVERLRNDAFMTRRNNGLPYSGRGIGVLINDSGVDGTHSDIAYPSHLAQNVMGSTNLNAVSDLLPVTWVENVPDTDSAGHGSHVTGIVGGNGARSNGKYAGVAPGATLVGYGSGVVIAILDTIGGLDYALTHQAQYGIRVTNNSWGPLNPIPFDPNDPVNVATKILHDHNIISVFAAGNSGPGPNTLNAYCAPWTICVANTHKDSKIESSSSRGTSDPPQPVVIDGQTWLYENRPTVSAPGTDIISARATGDTDSAASSNGPQDDVDMIEPANLPFYVVLSGTSMASPHVAGIVALMLEANPALTPDEVASILQQTATNLPGYNPWDEGVGMVNAYAAVDRAYRQGAKYGTTLVLGRTWNSSVSLTSSTVPISIDYNTVPSLSPTNNSTTVTVPSGLQQMVATVTADGLFSNTGNSLNLVAIAPDGTEYSSGITLLFAIDYARTVVIDSPMPGTWTLQIRGLRYTTDNPTQGAALPQTVQGSVSFNQVVPVAGLNDVANHPASASIMMAVGRHLIDGANSNSFAPDQVLTRGAVAPYMLEGLAVRQYLPPNGSASFTDVSSALMPYAEAVTARGSALLDMFQTTRGVMLPKSAGKFAPNDPLTRASLAYGFVQSLGLEAQALSLAGQAVTVTYDGQQIPIDDASQVPAGLEGYVQLALSLNIMQAYFSVVQGPYDLQPTIHANFQPTTSVTRAAYATHVIRFYSAFLANP